MKHTLKTILTIVVCCIALASLVSCPQSVIPEPPQNDPDPDPDPGPVVYTTPVTSVDGNIYDMAVDGPTLYIAGRFGLLGSVTGAGMPVLASTGIKPDNYTLRHINGIVYTAVPDGSGGWYVGGTFTKVGSETRNGIARINADGSLHAWNPDARDSMDYPASVRAILVHGSTVYVGGTFWKIGGQARRQVAAIDADGLATAWNPSPNMFVVDCLKAVGDKLYVLGDFTTIAGTGKTSIAAFSLVDGSYLATGSPTVVGRVLDLDFDGTWAYAVGDFTQIGGVGRNNIARFRIDNNTVDAGWYPTGGSNATCRAVCVDSTNARVFVGGDFSTIGGTSSYYAAALSITDAALIVDGMPIPNNGPVYRIVPGGTVVYISGGFKAVEGEPRFAVAAFDPSNGSLTSWNPGASRGDSSIVFALAASGDQVYIGGDVSIIGGVTRRNMAAIDLRTGKPTAWNPGADLQVDSIKIVGNVLYATGSFSTLGGAARQRFGAVSLSTGLATSFAPEPDGSVRAFAVVADRVYAGGDFTTIGGGSQKYLAALAPADGSLLAWTPTVEDFAIDDPASINGIAVSGSTVYISGWFPSVNGSSRYCLAALSASDATVLSWNPFSEVGSEPDSSIRHIFVVNGSVYVFGFFQTLCSQTRNSAAAFDAVSGALLAWDPDLGVGGNCPWKVFLYGDTFYIAGGFYKVGGEDRLAALAAVTTGGVLQPWAPALPGGLAYCVLATDTMLFAGGDFYDVGGLARQNVVSFLKSSGLPY